MREILFRGKRVDNGEWVYGYYWSNDVGNSFIKVTKENEEIVLKDYEVIPETVGQYTGLTGNGKQIFEGDLVKFTDNLNNSKIGVVGKVRSRYGIIYKEFKLDCFHSFERNIVSQIAIIIYSYEIIGNIHDNPELWEEEE